VTATISRFDATAAPCGKHKPGERCHDEDDEGLVTEEITFECGCKVTREEFHDGSFHTMTVDHHGKVLADVELRGE
jgi:hypothetical protein